VLWDAEKLAAYLVKGKQVHIEGRLQTRKWDDKDGNTRYTTEVVADRVQLLGSRDDSQPSEPAASRVAIEDLSAAIADDDVPF
jgi:single-strand DNA-binding protein